ARQMDDVIGSGQRQTYPAGTWGEQHYVEAADRRLKGIDGRLALGAGHLAGNLGRPSRQVVASPQELSQTLQDIEAFTEEEGLFPPRGNLVQHGQGFRKPSRARHPVLVAQARSGPLRV